MTEYCRLDDDGESPREPEPESEAFDDDKSIRKHLKKTELEVSMVNQEIRLRKEKVESLEMNDEDFGLTAEFWQDGRFWDKIGPIVVPSEVERNDFGRMRWIPINSEPKIKKIPVDILKNIRKSIS